MGNSCSTTSPQAIARAEPRPGADGGAPAGRHRPDGTAGTALGGTERRSKIGGKPDLCPLITQCYHRDLRHSGKSVTRTVFVRLGSAGTRPGAWSGSSPPGRILRANHT